MGKFHFFTEPDTLVAQTSQNAFGPVANFLESDFRVCNLFTGTTGSFQNAYAVTTGLAIVQLISGSTTVCNVILKPSRNMDTTLFPVKYIVYRGVKIASFMPSSTSTTLHPATTPNLPDIVNILYQDNTSIPILNYDALGINYSNTSSPDFLADYKLLDEIFESTVGSQFPYVQTGSSLGEFDTTTDFGIELILSDDRFNPSLGSVRSADHIVQVTNSPGADAIDERIYREEVLNYFDFSSFLGQSIGIHKWIYKDSLSNTATISGFNVFTVLLDKFANKHRLYVHFLDDTNYSCHLFGGFKESVNDYTRFKFEYDTQNLGVIDYMMNKWPLWFIDLAASYSTNPVCKMAFPNIVERTICEFINCKPKLNGETSKDVIGLLEIDDLDLNFSKTLELDTAIYDNSGTFYQFSKVLGFKLMKHEEPYLLEEGSTQMDYLQNTINDKIAKQNQLDLYFQPFNINKSWLINTIPSNTYKQGLAAPFANWSFKNADLLDSRGSFDTLKIKSSNSGLANDTIGETCFSMENEIVMLNPFFEKPISARRFINQHDMIIGNYLEQGKSFTFLEAFYSSYSKVFNSFVFEIPDQARRVIDFQSIEMSIEDILENGTSFSICQMLTYSDFVFGEKHVPLVSISYSYSDKDAMISLVSANFNGGLPIYFVFGAVRSEYNPLNSLLYYSINIYLRGFDSNNNVITSDPGIKLYSFDGLQYFSKDYSQQFKQISI